MQRLLIADAGLLIIFAKSDRLNILFGQAKDILITASVERECMVGNLKGSVETKSMIDQNRIEVEDDAPVRASIAKTILDQGEKSAISLAMNLSNQPGWLLMDEIRGRRIAIKNGAKVIGSIGLMLIVQRLGMINQIKPILDDWHEPGYWMNDSLMQRALKIE